MPLPTTEAEWELIRALPVSVKRYKLMTMPDGTRRVSDETDRVKILPSGERVFIGKRIKPIHSITTSKKDGDDEQA